tara:strand:+ start:163 stop:408 length:246 start_codon:yes stop_codon:yes gene_type:complete
MLNGTSIQINKSTTAGVWRSLGSVLLAMVPYPFQSEIILCRYVAGVVKKGALSQPKVQFGWVIMYIERRGPEIVPGLSFSI